MFLCRRAFSGRRKRDGSVHPIRDPIPIRVFLRTWYLWEARASILPAFHSAWKGCRNLCAHMSHEILKERGMRAEGAANCVTE